MSRSGRADTDAGQSHTKTAHFCYSARTIGVGTVVGYRQWQIPDPRRREAPDPDADSKVEAHRYFYRTPTKLREDNVFTGVCLLFCSGGCRLPDDTHPTGMLSCC